MVFLFLGASRQIYGCSVRGEISRSSVPNTCVEFVCLMLSIYVSRFDQLALGTFFVCFEEVFWAVSSIFEPLNR